MTDINIKNVKKAASKSAEQLETNTNLPENTHCSTRKTMREVKLRDDLTRRLKRVEGQVRGISGMVERDVYCDDVLHQIAAARSALKSISHLVMEDHIHGCLVERIRKGEDEVVDELLVTIGKLL